MSTWTNVLCSFHVGGDVADPDMNLLLESILGPPYVHVNFHDNMDTIKVPCGSEGPLQWDIALEPYTSGFYRGAITVWGNLRDFTDLASVVSWFKRTVVEFRAHGFVYSAICTAYHNSSSQPRGLSVTITDADVPEREQDVR